jgi:hypothetical protein
MLAADACGPRQPRPLRQGQSLGHFYFRILLDLARTGNAAPVTRLDTPGNGLGQFFGAQIQVTSSTNAR